MKRPSVEASLKPLKAFQRCTVEHAFHRLFTADDSTGRFLVADEVGLGKTLVARGVIARAIDHLWNDVKRIDIVYICSNGSIARANLPKLQVGGAEQRSFALATRLTMLATELAHREGESGLADSKLNFVSFTPGTSFNMGHSAGQGREREVLFQLLHPLVGPRTALMNFLQGYITKRDEYRSRLKNYPRPINATIRQRFEAAFHEHPDLQSRLRELLDTSFRRYRSWPAEARYQRDQVISELRRVLAGACVKALEPDLVILDEFQRFKSLLDTRDTERDPAAGLAQELFQAEAHDGKHDGKRVRTLLLSATPYKLYTADAEIEHEEHYEDFLATTRFLLGDDEARVEEVKHQLSRFGAALRRAAAGDPEQMGCVELAKRTVEGSLRDVMARTERVAASDDRDAMVAEDRRTATVTASDVRQYLAADALFSAVGGHDPMPFWKSAPYLAHFMHGYKFNELVDEAINAPDKMVDALQRHDSAFLKAATLRSWGSIDPGHAKLRELVGELIGEGLWRLLWMPPTLPYWPLEGPFEGREQVTKRLLFSAWNVVPDVVSAVLSYEAERLMTGGRLKSYDNPDEQQRPLLRLTQSTSGVLSRHRLLLLLLPCLPLADRAHPLDAPAGEDRRAWVRARVEELLADPRLPNPQGGNVDDRWEWAAPLMLDPELPAFLRAWRDDELHAWSDAEPLPQPNPEIFGQYVDDLLEIDPRAFGRRPPDLAELFTDVALGSPAILAARSMRGGASVGDDTRRRLAALIADAFWRLFNRPAVIALLRQLAPGTAARDESAYWRLVLRYCQHGNLQAVLDEQWHMLWDQESWSEDAGADETAGKCARKLVQVVHPTRARVHGQFFRAERGASGGSVEREELRVRTVFALRFGQSRTDDGDYISQDAVRAAFNGPFRPFVLASTSIGQEGLDFHPWCHRLIHWNLPGNPVDLEQREGRIHRYKGHAVRRNVAASHGLDAFASWSAGDDIWRLMFELADRAARAAGASDLVPHWIAPGEHRVQRHVPQLPYTTEIEAFERLKRQLAAYRVVFGQPRQEELVTLLDQSGLDVTRLRDWAVDLSPPATS